MELLEGETLAARIRRARVPHDRALQIVRSVARALHAAHEQGIVHRDIKPDNIFIVPDPEMPTGERIKLLDFGIAKLGSDGTAPGLTRTGAVMGTPLYMSPEQCRGAGTVDRRSDLYALGCILYELLCGRPPFVAEGAGDLIARHLYFQPEPPRLFDPRIPPRCEGLTLTLLHKDPTFRPPTALALVEQIDRLAVVAGGPSILPAGGSSTLPPGGGPASAPEPTLVSPPLTTLGGATSSLAVQKPPRSRRTRLLVASSVVAAAVIVVTVAVTRRERDPNGGITAEPRLSAALHGSSDPTVVAVPDAAASAQLPPADDAAVAAPSSASTDTAMASLAPPPASTPPPAPPSSVSPSLTLPSPKLSSRAAAPVRSAASRPRRERASARLAEGPGNSPSPAPSIASPEVSSKCTRSSFEPVLQAKQPDEATVQAALTQLRACQKELAPDVYAELQQQLISKL